MNILTQWKTELNGAQTQAITSETGPHLILAGAGSGKTRVLTYRVAQIIMQGLAAPNEILAVTFTNKAAREMRERIHRIMGTMPIDMPEWIGTFHSIGVKVLKKHIHLLDFSTPFVIYDVADQISLIKNILKRMKICDKENPPKNFKNLFSEAKVFNSDYRSARQWLEENVHEDIVPQVFDEYQKQCHKNNALDFSDLLLKTNQLFTEYPDVLLEYQNQFRHVLIDEYQDTNTLQYRLIKMLAGDRHNIFAVGDEDQSIYSWRGSDINNILNFEKDFPNCKIIKLEENFRSSQNIVDAASTLIGHNSQRKHKKLFSQKEVGEKISLYAAYNEFQEASFVSEYIYRLSLKGQQFRDIAILYRTHAQSRVLEEALRRLHIPYKIIGGVRFYDRKEIKDIIAYLRVIENPSDDVALLRIINTPARGIGKVSVDKLITYAHTHQYSLMEAIKKSLQDKTFNTRTSSQLERFFYLIQGFIMESRSKGLLELLFSILKDSRYEDTLRGEQGPEVQARLDNINEFKRTIEHFESVEKDNATLQNFLEQTALLTDNDEVKTDNMLSMMTLHTAKGLEFPIVLMVGLEDGLLPLNRTANELDINELEEERRLAYVGITRAQKKVILSYAKSRRHWNYGVQPTQVSPFLKEISKKYIESIS